MPKLTLFEVENARPSPQGSLLADGQCLFLRVRPLGNGKQCSRTWIVRIKRNGKRRVHTIGTFPAVSIKEARAKAAKLVAVDRGAARVSVAVAVDEFMDLQIRPRYRRPGNPEVYCRAVKSALGRLAIDAVRPVDVSRMVAAYKRTSPVAAMRLLTFVKGFLTWAAGYGYLDQSPARDISPGAFGVTEQSRERILTDSELRALWHADDLSHAPLLRFLVLTGLRLSEAQRATHAAIDREHWLTIPGEHSKNRKPHRVYLPPLARAQIDDDAGPHLFPPISSTAVEAAPRRWQERHGANDRWTPHDLRRTFASAAGDLGVAPHIIARLLNHTIPGGASLPVYLRSEWFEERKQAAIALAAHVAAVVVRK